MEIRKKLIDVERLRQTPTSESLVDKWLVRCINEAGGLTFKMNTTSTAGLPDRIVHWRNMTFYVETKTTNEQCTPLQVEVHKRIKERGIETYVLDVKITELWDLFTVAYTTYVGRHYNNNPHKQSNGNVRQYDMLPVKGKRR